MKSAHMILVALAASASVAAASLRGYTAPNPAGVDLVTFDGAKDTTYHWKDLNDPVMGGESSSTWTIDTQVHKTAVWDGEARTLIRARTNIRRRRGRRLFTSPRIISNN